MRVLRISPEEIWIDTEPEALAAALRHLETYKIGRDVAIADVTGERAILSLIGPRSVEIAATAPLPEYACGSGRVAGVECLAVGTAEGIDLISRAADAEQPARRARRLRRDRGRRDGRRGRAHRGRQAALRSRDEHRDDARRGRHRRARGQLHQGLLHRPGAGRPPPLQGPPEPPPARSTAQRPGDRGREPTTRREGGRHGRQRLHLPRPSGRSRWRSSAARPSPAPSWP